MSLTQSGGEIPSEPEFDLISEAPAISSDGRYVAFVHSSSALVASDTGHSTDVFVRDTLTGTNELISVAADGSHPNPFVNGEPVMTSDGRYVVFSASSSLTPGASGYGDVYLRDRTLASTELISRGLGGQVPDDSSAQGMQAITADGRYVAFTSYSTNLVAGDTNGEPDLFVLDRVTGTMALASVSSAGTQSNGETLDSVYLAVSPAGHVVVAFHSDATNLVAGDAGSGEFLRDLTSGQTNRLVGPANVASVRVTDLSPDGMLVVYQKLVGNDLQVFLLDRSDDSVELISANTVGAPSSSVGELPEAQSSNGNISEDGRFVGFGSTANDLVENDTNTFCDEGEEFLVSCGESYVRDRLTGITTRVSVADDGTQSDGRSYPAQLSGDGSAAAFTSYASNLVPGDANDMGDVFVAQLGSPGSTSANVAPGGTLSSGGSTSASVPLVVSVTTPQGGLVSIVVGDTSQTAPQGFTFFGQQETISAPNATASAPLAIAFTLDDSLFSLGDDPLTTQIFRSELPGGPSLVPDCSATSPAISPDPCVSSRVPIGGGVTVTVLTTQASDWNLGLSAGPPPVEGWMQRVSVTQAGDQIEPGVDINPGPLGPVVSSDGRFVAFSHTSPDLVPGDSSNSLDVFVRDTLTDTNELISVASDGSHPLSPITGGLLAMTPDGRYVVFTSHAVLAPGATGIGDVYVRDRTLGTTELISQGLGGEIPDSSSGDESAIAITPDGRYVAFESYATNLVAGDTNGQPDLFVFDRVSQSMERASVSTSGVEADSATTGQADFAITAAGHVVLAFSTGAANLVAGDPGYGMFFRDLTTGETTRIVDPPGDGYARLVDLSPDGTLVVFTVDVDNGFGSQVFVLDRSDSSIELISTNNLGEPSAAIGRSSSGLNQAGNMSDDGRYVGFASNAYNLVGGDTNDFCSFTPQGPDPHHPGQPIAVSCPEAFVRDRLSHTTTRVSIADDGTQGNKDSFIPWISGDGSTVVFRSNSSNFVPGDTNGMADIFLRPLRSQPRSASGVVAPGNSINAGTTTNASVPVAASVTTPQGGSVSIDIGDSNQAPPPGFTFFGQQVTISAPVATNDAPIGLAFALDASLFPPGSDLMGVQVLRSEPPGEPTNVPDCGLTSPYITPDPCVSDRSPLGGGVVVTVLTTHASVWNFGLGGPPAPTYPTVASFVADPAPVTNKTKIDFVLTFDVAVTSLAADDFTIGGTSTGWSVTVVDGPIGGAYTIQLDGPSSTEGTVELTLGADSVVDAESDSGPSLPVTATAVVDRTVPMVSAQLLTPGSVIAGSPVTATSSATDAGGVASGQLQITSLSAPSYLNTLALDAVDGAFDGTIEAMTTTIAAPPNAGTYLVCALAYDPASNVSAGTGCRTLTVTKLNQTVSFANPGTKTMLQSPLTVSPTATSGLFVSLTSNTPLVCSTSGHDVTLLAAGSCSLSASQTGNISYNPSNTVTRVFTVNQVAQSITFANPGNRTMAESPVTLNPTSSSGLPVTLISTTVPVCTVSGLEVTFLGPGTCSLMASQAGNAAYKPASAIIRTFAVKKVNQTISFASPGATSFGASPIVVSPTASSGLTVLLISTTPTVCTVSGHAITLVSVGSCGIQAQQAGDAIYNAASTVTRSFNVTKADQTITFPNPGPRSMGAPVVHTGVTSSAGLTVTLTSSTTSVCTVSGTDITLLKAGTCTVKATQAGNASYKAATAVTRTFTVSAALARTARPRRDLPGSA